MLIMIITQVSHNDNNTGKPWPHWPEDTDVEEGVWRDYYTGEKLEDFPKPWNTEHDERHGEGTDCLGLSTWWPEQGHVIQFNESWWEGDCTSSWRGCPCKNDELPPLLFLRGLCPSSRLRTMNPNIGLQFTPIQRPHLLRDVWFKGGMSSKIQLNFTGDGKWTLSDDIWNTTANTNAPKDSYALGKNEWLVTGDDLNCHEGEPYKTFLKLTGCLEGEFTCDDGQCVRMEQRCDQLPDCEDKSDERGCKLLLLEEGYNKRVPPITAKSALDRTIVPVSVGVSIVLMEVVSIDEVDHSIQLQFEVILNWQENRATYLNLKQKTALNKMTEDDIKRLWLPLIIYTNTDQKKTTRLGEYGNGEWSTAVTVTRESNFTRADLDEVDETEIFEGADNGLTMRQTYTHRFQCNYLLSRYPFDTQVCTIKMNVATLDLDTVKLIPRMLVMEQEEEMTIFHIINRELVYRNTSQPQDGVLMFIVLKRKITSEMMTTYFPTIMLTAITFATTFFKPYFFEAALTVNLTTMLVMTTIFISKMDGLPPTSAIKMIDIWLIMCQLVPFCEVVLLTAIEYNDGGEQGAKGEKTKTINHHGTIRVIKLDEKETQGENREKPEKAWNEDGGNTFECSKRWIPNLKSIRKYWNTSLIKRVMIKVFFRNVLSPVDGCSRSGLLLSCRHQLLF